MRLKELEELLSDSEYADKFLSTIGRVISTLFTIFL